MRSFDRGQTTFFVEVRNISQKMVCKKSGLPPITVKESLGWAQLYFVRDQFDNAL